jgi:hypothetical protein
VFIEVPGNVPRGGKGAHPKGVGGSGGWKLPL